MSDFQTTDELRELLQGRLLRFVDATSTKTDRPRSLAFIDIESADPLAIFVGMGALEARIVPMAESVREEIQEVLQTPKRVIEQPDDLAALLAMNVRNALERFHAADEDDKIEGLDDAAMAKVNPAIRRAIYEVLVALNASQSGDMEAAEKLQFLAQMVPSEWEPASDLPPSDVF